MLAAKLERPITVQEYYRLAEEGILQPGERVELLAGIIEEMAPIGSAHGGEVNQLAHWLTIALKAKAIVAIQNPVRLSEDSEPQPDIAILHLRKDFYRRSHPVPRDVLLLIEVAETTLAKDRRKAGLYAAAGIPEYWIVDLVGQAIEVYRKPAPAGYGEVKRYGRGDRISPQAFSSLKIDLKKLLPGKR